MAEAFIDKAALRGAIDRLKVGRGAMWVASFCTVDQELIGVSVGNVAVEAIAKLLHPTEDDFTFTIALPELDRWADSVTDEICVTLEDHVVTFTTPDAELPIPEIHDGFAVMPPPAEEKYVLPGRVWHALGSVAWAAHPKDLGTFAGMLHLADGLVYATNRHNAAIVEMDDLDADSSFWPGLADALGLTDPDLMDSRIDSRGNLHISDEQGRFVVPPFVGQKPTASQMKTMARQDPQHHPVTVDRKEMEKALGALKKLQAHDSEAVWLTFAERMTLTVVTGDSTPTTRQLDYDGEGVDIAFKLDTLQQAVKGMADDEITLELVDSKSHARMRESSYTVVMAPQWEGAPARRGKRR